MQYGARGIRPTAPDLVFDNYFWLDYCCIDQNEYSIWAQGVYTLPLYVACCTDFVIYESETAEYEKRAWTRIERMLTYAFNYFPNMIYIHRGYPDVPPDLNVVVAKSPETCSIGGSGELILRVANPCGKDAQVSKDQDSFIISGLKELCES